MAQEEVARLIASLSDEDVLVRVRAAQALGQLGDDRAIEPLIDALKHVDQNPVAVRDQIAYALGNLKDRRAVEPLINVLMWDNYVRAAAAKALGQIGDARAVKPLQVALEKQHDFQNNLIHQNAREALQLIGEPIAEPTR